MQRIALAAVFVAGTPVANWMMANVGTVCVPRGPCLLPVGFGLMAPSGVFVIGALLVVRDRLQHLVSPHVISLCIAAGCALAFATSPAQLAIASSIAFGVSELLDWGIYSRLRRATLAGAVLLSGAAAAVVDSILFSWLAFGEVKWAAGLIAAKMAASLIAAALLLTAGRARA